MKTQSKFSYFSVGLFISLNLLFSQAHAERFKKVVWVIFENTNYQSAMKQADFMKIGQSGSLFTNMQAETHPSQGNYIAMVAGSVLGVKNDKPVDLGANHIGDLLEKSGMDWRVYAENYPGGCFTGAVSGKYVRKHVPFMSFTNVSRDKARCLKIQNESNFFSDFNAGTLPEFSMYIPNIDNDGHDTDINFAGRWLTSKFGSLFATPSALGDTLFIITFDENEGTPGNQIYTAFVGANVIAGSTNTQALNHTAILKMIEDELHLGDLGRGDAGSPEITGIWK